MTCTTEYRAQPVLDIHTATNHQAIISFPSESGSSYRLLSNPTADTVVGWTSFSNVLGTGTNISVPIALNRQKIFYALGMKKNPLYGMNFFVDTNSAAAQWANTNRITDPTNAALMDTIGTNATSMWLTGVEPDVYYDVTNRMMQAEDAGQMPVFTLYNLPHRDCGSFSSGGATNADDYIAWISRIALGIDNRQAVIILEPDSLAHLDCSSLVATQKTERLELTRSAILILKTRTLASVYIDGGHANWQSADTMSKIFTQVGITNADGFALNVSNFQWDTNTIAFGTAISKKLADIHFVVDTSRNGRGPDTNAADVGLEWCNPPERALGKMPTSDTRHPLIDAYLWIKAPGESDGSCRTNEPPRGIFWPEDALGLAQRALY
jgi:endoglucanase